MAIEDPINDDEEAPKAKPKGRWFLKALLIVLSVVLLVATSVAATLWATGALSGDQEVASASESGSKSKDKGKGKKKATEKAPPIYVELGDPFVVNFTEGNQIRYLQAKIEAMTRDPLAAQAIDTHLPQIRNNLVLMLSSLDYGTLSTVAGKQKIRDEALAEIQSVLKQETGDDDVEAVYFTSFVMQ